MSYSKSEQVRILRAVARGLGVNEGQVEYSYGSGLVVCGRNVCGVKDGRERLKAWAREDGSAARRSPVEDCPALARAFRL